jgi:uncharacterized protein YdeI (BOF family)
MKNFVLMITLALFSSVAFGQKVNFSGEWKLNEGKSELGDQFSLAPKALTVAHTKKTLDLTSLSEFDGQEVENKQHVTLNGEECENVGFGESVTQSTAKYDKKAKTLTVVTKGSVQGMNYTLTQTLSMKEGNLMVESNATSDMGDMFETFIFDKK